MWIAGAAGDASDEQLVGGKAAKLHALTALGLPVPTWFAVTTHVFDDIVDRCGSGFRELLARAALGNAADVEHSIEALRQQFAAVGFSADQGSAILRAHEVRLASGGFVAVRSSAVGEDSAESSFAGQMDSFLFVDREALLARVLDCFMSAFSPRCLLYRRLRGTAPGRTSAAVVIQRMVDSSTSGVVFSLAPGGVDEMAVSAAFGLGEGVVQDHADVDTYVLDRRRPDVLERNIAVKSKQVLAKVGSGGTYVADVPTELARTPVLRDDQLRQLWAAARTIEKHLGAPQDFEWAFDRAGKLHFLQTRPITTSATEATRVFDNANISENYQGVTTVLTYSYVKEYYESIFAAAARDFGLSSREVTKHRDLFANMVAFLNGNLYYNLNNWYRLFFLIPGFHLWVGAFEEGVGLDGTPPELVTMRRRMARRLSLTSRAAAWVRVAWCLLRLPFMMRGFERRFDRYRTSFARINLRALTIDGLLEQLQHLRSELATRWQAPLVNDYYAFIAFSLTRRLARRWAFDADGSLFSDLTRGNGKLASLAPIASLVDLARQLRTQPALLSIVAETPPAEAWRLIDSDPSHVEFRRAVLEHIDRFGDRRFDELKLETRTLADDPAQLLLLVLNHARGSPAALAQRHLEAARAQGDARRAITSALRWHPVRRGLLFLLAKLGQVTMRYREFGRLARSRRCGIERSLLLAIADRLVSAGVLKSQDDVFHLTVDELAAFIQGASTTRSLAALVDVRQLEYAEHTQHPLPPRVTTLGAVHVDLASGTSREPEQASEAEAMLGLGCSPGRARGRARVVHDPAHCVLNEGDILVAKATDPAWAFLMVAAAGLVVERGNLLSHAAIVGRELGIPTVTGVDGLMKRVVDGQMLEIDGGRGTVRIIAPPSTALADNEIAKEVRT